MSSGMESVEEATVTGLSTPESAPPIVLEPIGKVARTGLTYRPVLDVVRFLAAIWVMLEHAEAVSGGGHAVAVFFVLSGFLIGGQLISEKRKTNSIALYEFYFKRVTRIWVPYFIVLAFVILLFYARGQDAVPGFYGRMVGALTYTYNLVNDFHGNIHETWGSFNQIWSLSIEEQFYLVVPLLIIATPTRLVVPASIALAGLFLYARPLYAGLFVGVSLAGIFAQRNAIAVPPRAAALLGGAFVAVYASLFAVGQTGISQASWITYGLSGATVLLANFIPLPRWTHAPLRYAGLMTYSYYLIHGLPVYFLGAIYRRFLGVSELPLWLQILCGLLALPVSYLFVRCIELPTLRFRGQMLRDRSRWVYYAPYLAWSLSLVGIVALVHAATR